MCGSAFAQLLAATQAIAADVAAHHAHDVDAKSRFPHETLHALRSARVLSAAVPAELGGGGCSLSELAALCAALSRGCGASGMVLAMHTIEVACIARHAPQSPCLRRFLEEDVARGQALIASATSELGTYGDTRSSICAIVRAGGRVRLRKDATTVSYGEAADAVLATARRGVDAASSDQVLVLFTKGDCALTQTSNWDALGMRGTCSPGFRLDASAPQEQVLPCAFAEIFAQTMVPYSHVLWSSVWWGVAADALARAAALVRGQARGHPGSVPPGARRLAQASGELQQMRSHWAAVAAEVDRVSSIADGMHELLSVGWGLKLNNLKIAASEAAPRLVHHALQITGMQGYRNDTPFSVGRHYRDVLSASLMISNERLAAQSASMLLVLKDHDG